MTACAVIAILGRLIQLQGVDETRYRDISAKLRVLRLPLPAVRGAITSSDGTVLAMTVQTDQVAIDPTALAPVPLAQAAAKLAGPLLMPASAVLAKLQHPTSRQYVVLKQTVSAAAADRLQALNLGGLILTPSYARVYPDGDLAANLVGFTDKRGAGGELAGMAGLEQAYNSLLAGRPGLETARTDVLSNPIPGTESVVRPAVGAAGLRLTIQADIQWAAERECQLRVQATHAKTCTIVVMSPRTGDILAMAQYPLFNPAGPASVSATTDLPVASIFAPGSTAKVITAAAAFEHGGQTPLSRYTVPDAIDWHGYVYHDAEAHPTEHYTIAGIIAHSSNDGMVQVAAHVTPAQQYAEFQAFGIGSPSGLNLPGETDGLLPPYQSWNGAYRNERYMIAFGQGVDVTALQMASVYATIADGGIRVTPRLVAGTTNDAGQYSPARPAPWRRVIKRSTAAELMSILEQVPMLDARGGAPWGLIPGYTVAAKTGTAQEPGGYGSSFIGIAPATNPQLVVAVNIQDPKRGYFGIDVAGPAFYDVMKFALATMKIPPDHGHVPYVPLTGP